jgi:putative ABC transport system permease protein
MWRHNALGALRALTRSRSYALINLAGLAIGLAACLLLLVYVRHELGYDRWIPDHRRIFQVQTASNGSEGGEAQQSQLTAFAAAEAMRRGFPQIEQAVWALPEPAVTTENGVASRAEGVLFADGPFFDVVPVEFVRGGRAAALAAPGNVVLTEGEALRRFGAADPIGRTLTLTSWGKTIDYRVTGIVRDPPRASHLSFNMVARFDPPSFFAGNEDILTNWGWQSGYVYLKLRPGADAAAIARQLPAWEARNIPDQAADGAETNIGTNTDWRLVNVADVHLGEGQAHAMRPGNDRRSIAAVATIAFFILIVAAINFTNLTTARATRRAREVALRKLLGAKRRQLVAQFLGEAALMTGIAALLALAIVEVTLPAFGAWLDAPLSLGYYGWSGVLLPLGGLSLAVAALAGLYPAFILSRFQPGQVLKANRSAPEPPGSGRIRTALVVVQFAISIALIACTAIVYRQTVFARDSDPGYEREGILQISGLGDAGSGRVRDALHEEIARIDGVTAVGRTSIGVATTNSANTNIHLPGRAAVEIGNYPVDSGFFEAMGIDILAGRGFSDAQALDDATIPYPSRADADRALAERGINVVVNALAARRLGFGDDPGAAVGRQIRAALVAPEHGLVPATIVGVAEDSRLRSAREAIAPVMFRMSRGEHQYMVVRYAGADADDVRRRAEAVWRRLVPDAPFEAAFAQDLVAGLYAREEAAGEAFAAFSLLAVLIACLGLFGLAAFTAERRTREIGIRKVFGATTRDIVRLLALQFSKPVVLANLLAWPAAWWAMREWLNGFEARIDLGPGPFLLAGLIALAVALGTISGHAVKVARSNPIHALRYE